MRRAGKKGYVTPRADLAIAPASFALSAGAQSLIRGAAPPGVLGARARNNVRRRRGCRGEHFFRASVCRRRLDAFFRAALRRKPLLNSFVFMRNYLRTKPLLNIDGGAARGIFRVNNSIAFRDD